MLLVKWDLRIANKVVDELIGTVSDDNRRDELKTINNDCSFIISQFRSDFRTQIVHGDLAHYNVIALSEPNGRYLIYLLNYI